MSYIDMLTLHNAVAVVKEVTTPDLMGGTATTVTTITTLTKAQIWQSNSFNRYLSDKVAKDSSHVLAFIPGEYAFTDVDVNVTYNSKVFRPVGHPDNVANQNIVEIIGLERIT